MCVSRLINFLPLALSTSLILLIPTQLPRFVSFPNTIPHTRRCMPSMNNPKHHLDHIQLITTAPNLRTDIFQSRRPIPQPQTNRSRSQYQTGGTIFSLHPNPYRPILEAFYPVHVFDGGNLGSAEDYTSIGMFA